MRTKIISAFPGMGKSYYAIKNPGKSIDLDSSSFSWVKDSEGNNTESKNPEFPGNYIKNIRENIGKYKYIFISSHREVREAMKDECLHFHLIYPGICRREEFINRYKERGNSEKFIKRINESWESWIEDCATERGCKVNVLTEGNLTDLLKTFENE